MCAIVEESKIQYYLSHKTELEWSNHLLKRASERKEREKERKRERESG